MDELVGWKRCRNAVLVKLRVPPDARRRVAPGGKCRAERAEVLEVVGAEVGRSFRDPGFEYRAGRVAACHAWHDGPEAECSGGIHFFLTRREAEAFRYYFVAPV